MLMNFAGNVSSKRYCLVLKLASVLFNPCTPPIGQDSDVFSLIFCCVLSTVKNSNVLLWRIYFNKTGAMPLHF